MSSRSPAPTVRTIVNPVYWSYADGSLDKYTYHHNLKHHGLPEPEAEGARGAHFPSLIFDAKTDHTSTYNARPWIIHKWPLGTGTYAYVNIAKHKLGVLQVASKTVILSAEDQEAEREKDEDEDDLESNHSQDSSDSLTSTTSSAFRARRPLSTEQLKANINEVKVLQKLLHPNVASFLDVFKEEEEKRVHLIMELVTGGDLWSYLDKHTSLIEEEVAFVAYQLCKATSYLHPNNVAHRGETAPFVVSER